MFKISLQAILNNLWSAPNPPKYDTLVDVMMLEEPQHHPVLERLLQSLRQDRTAAKTEGEIIYYYNLAALELTYRVILNLPIERLPLGHEALAEAPQVRSLMALVWAAQFLAYCEGKEPFSIYDENTGARVWSIADDNVKAEDFYNYFSVEA